MTPSDSCRGYAVVTPVRDEEENLARLASCLLAQTLLPARWIIVDNGSSDGTGGLAHRLAQAHAWVTTASARGEARAVPGAPIVRAFHAGLAQLQEEVDVVVKVDADVSVDAAHFETLLAAFDADPSLGIAGGHCYELEGEEWLPTQSNGTHVRGAVRAYRRACLDELLPLAERTGWDTIDEYQAAVRGWTTARVDGLRFKHHRAVGARDGGRSRRWQAKGSAAHYVGYRPLYLVLRALYNSRSDPAALAMIWGYTAAAARREPRHPDRDARALVRQNQTIARALARGRAVRAPAPARS